MPLNAAAFPGALDKCALGPRKMQDLAQGYGLEVAYMPASPLLEYNPRQGSTTRRRHPRNYCKGARHIRRS
ncbi:protein of unknown function [Paraburkholderia dioscoreae]|uniref:Uncharacterized protein n=1 Tax=Paraburkholderia dioscoreae TaxID=2604047 RepID=A0A5Q4ZNZ1_9BURK|nr:protein of unknown function [Paraburkholderia dioscoreae]